MLKTESKKIGECVYHVTQLDAETGTNVLLRITKLLSPALAASNVSNEEKLKLLLDNLKQSTLKFVQSVLARSTIADFDGRKTKLSDIYNVHFAGKYDELGQWLIFALMVNYRDFLAKLVPGGLNLETLLKPESPAK